MDDRPSQFRQQPIPPGVPDFQLNKPTGKIFVVRQCTDFALACAAASLYGSLAGTWPFWAVEGVWALIAPRRWWLRQTHLREQTLT